MLVFGAFGRRHRLCREMKMLHHNLLFGSSKMGFLQKNILKRAFFIVFHCPVAFFLLMFIVYKTFLTNFAAQIVS